VAAFQVRALIFQLRHERVRQVRPDLGERPLAHVAERHVPPELVGVHRAVPTDAPDAVARRVAAVHPEELRNVGGARASLAHHPVIQVRPVGVVIDGQNLHGPALAVQGRGLVDDPVDDPPRGGVVQVFRPQRARASRVHEMVEADARDVLLAQEVEDAVDLPGVPPRDRESQAHLDARGLAVADALNRAVERPRDAAEPVVYLAQAVERHAYIAQAHALQAPGRFGADERAVRGDDRTHLQGHGALHERKEVVPHERLAARKKDHRHAEAGEVLEQGKALVGRQLARVLLVLRLAVAVDAPQVARAGAVPDDDGLLVGRELEEVAGQALALGAIPEHIARFHRAAIEF
jgi:hypothetical protein